MTMLLLATAGTAAAQEDISRYAVIPAPKDCENTVLLKAIVKASNIGKAYAEYDNVRILLKRSGSDREHCAISMLKETDGKASDTQSFQCVFDYPFGQE